MSFFSQLVGDDLMNDTLTSNAFVSVIISFRVS